MTNNQREKILGELGIIWVTYALTCAGWDVFRKMNDKGFDLLARKNGKEKWIEVKARDMQKSTGKNAKSVTTGCSNAQNQHAEYLALYVHGYGAAVLLPTTLPLVEDHKSRNGLTVGHIRNDEFVVKVDFQKYLNNFELK